MSFPIQTINKAHAAVLTSFTIIKTNIYALRKENGITTLVSLTLDGKPANNDSITNPAISGDGRHVAFASNASNLVANDNNGKTDVFVRDLATNMVVRVSVASDGTEGNNYSIRPAISDNGRYVVFISSADNLVGYDPNEQYDVFVRDRDVDNNGTYDELGNVKTIRKSVGNDGTESKAQSDNPSISGDGRLVAFKSGDLIPGINCIYLFVYDQVTQELRCVAVTYDGTPPHTTGNATLKSSLSSDGQYIVFDSGTTNLIPDDTNGFPDIFLTDLKSDITTLISIGLNGEQANGGSSSAAISDDGKFVVFSSSANNLVEGDTLGYSDVFIRDVNAGINKRVSIASNGTDAFDHSGGSDFSSDGRYISFTSRASNLVNNDNNDTSDIFLHDMNTRETFLISVGIDGNSANAESHDASIANYSSNGLNIAFHSKANNLVNGDINGKSDIFNREVKFQYLIYLPLALNK